MGWSKDPCGHRKICGAETPVGSLRNPRDCRSGWDPWGGCTPGSLSQGETRGAEAAPHDTFAREVKGCHTVWQGGHASLVSLVFVLVDRFCTLPFYGELTVLHSVLAISFILTDFPETAACSSGADIRGSGSPAQRGDAAEAATA